MLLGNYEELSMDCLPPLWLAYLSDPSDSGQWLGVLIMMMMTMMMILSRKDSQQRQAEMAAGYILLMGYAGIMWLITYTHLGEKKVVDGMKHFADLTDQAKYDYIMGCG